MTETRGAKPGERPAPTDTRGRATMDREATINIMSAVERSIEEHQDRMEILDDCSATQEAAFQLDMKLITELADILKGF